MNSKGKALEKSAKLSRVLNPTHGAHLSDSEYQNSMDKYDAQRKRRRN